MTGSDISLLAEEAMLELVKVATAVEGIEDFAELYGISLSKRRSAKRVARKRLVSVFDLHREYQIKVEGLGYTNGSREGEELRRIGKLIDRYYTQLVNAAIKAFPKSGFEGFITLFNANYGNRRVEDLIQQGARGFFLNGNMWYLLTGKRQKQEQQYDA